MRKLAAGAFLVAGPVMAVQTALAFWRAHNINEAADVNDVGRVTELVNGSSEGLADRVILTRRAISLLAA